MARLKDIRKSADLLSYRRREISINSGKDLEGVEDAKVKMSLDPNCGGTGGRGDKTRSSLEAATSQIQQTIKNVIF
jgi:hypothetical protein